MAKSSSSPHPTQAQNTGVNKGAVTSHGQDKAGHCTPGNTSRGGVK